MADSRTPSPATAHKHATLEASPVFNTWMELSAELARDLEGAFPDLVKTLQNGVFSTALQMVRHRHDAEDITQETFVRVYRALAEFPPERIRELRVRSYVWTTLINLCRNRARTVRRRPEAPLVDDVGTADVSRDWVEASEVWRPRLAQLSARQRTAVVLRHVAGLSYVEIAETLDIPVGTAKADVHRGLGRLRTMIEAEGEVA